MQTLSFVVLAFLLQFAIGQTSSSSPMVQQLFACLDCSHVPYQSCINRVHNCPMCMAYLNETEPTIMERRCCLSNCGPAYQVSLHNGRPTYFCRGDICNIKFDHRLLGAVW